ncbi:hypothetical protein LJB96_04515 [Methanobrevibacter sp. OttesenSCG-928-K11]|nr:hypothetical protein [Methanobrevibacter sp. OttesenSCG-928-K11]MDL2270339.1 hypothetical protein [Methanobrevibacter sp. OttesenSCG-928-I08]
MAKYGLSRYLVKLLTNHEAISMGTKYFPTTPIETEYVELFNYTQTALLEIEKANITTDSIFQNLIRDLGEENIPKNHDFYELKPADNKIEEYALVSNIIMGSDRYLFIELHHPSHLINVFSDIIMSEKGEIVEKSSTELVAKLFSKNDAIKLAIRFIGMGLENNLTVSAAVGMTGAAAIERSINFTKNIGNFSGVAFTKLGGEFALVFDSPFIMRESKSSEFQNYLFIDVIDSTKFIDKHGRDYLVELMNGIKTFIEEECEGELEGYREGGDDFIARFPSKDLAIRAGLDSAWFGLNNGVKIRAGIGKSRREAGEKAQLADNINSFTPLSLVVFELANGVYAYNVPSEFARTIFSLLNNHKMKLFGIFLLVFIIAYFGAVLGYNWVGLVAVAIALIYALAS